MGFADNQNHLTFDFTMIKVLLFEDNRDFAESFIEMINDAPDMQLAAAFNNSKQAAQKVAQYHPDVILMDIDMPLQDGMQGLREIRNTYPDVPILMQTVFDDNERVFQAICDGATGYVLKKTTPEKMLDYIREAVNGGAPMTPSIARQVLKLFSAPFQHKRELVNLTPREHDVLALLVRGFSYKMIAAEQNVSIETVRSHIKNIYDKLHVNSKSEAVIKALQNKLV